METLNLTQDQLNQLSNLILEIPTRYGIPLHNLLASFIESQKASSPVVQEEAKLYSVES